ncbi:leucine-rich repeat protein [Parabacteroides sp.]
MIERTKTILIFMLLALSMAGCQDDLPQSAQIETGKESLAFTQGSGTRTVKITASQAWTATSSGAWLTVSPAKGGSGTHELTLTAVANTTASSRTAEVSVQVGHKISTIRVTQAQQDALGLDRNSETVAWPAGSLEVTLSANVDDYQISCDADWLEVAQTKAMTEHTLRLSYAENETYEARTATVTVANGTLSSTFTVTQGGRGALYFVLASDTVAYDAYQYELVLMKNTSSNGLRLLDEAGWLSLSDGTRAMPEEERVILSLQPNMGTAPREARLVISDESTGTLLTDTFTLVQRGLENLLQPGETQHETAAGGETFDLPVTASGPFEVILPEDADWLTGSAGVQLPGTLQFTVAENSKPAVRMAVITLRLQNGSGMEATVTITQAAAEVPETDQIPRLYNLLELSTVIETDPVNLGAFRATVAYDENEPTGWLNDIYAYGGKLHFRLDGNSTPTKRSATIRLALEAGETIEIRVNQSGTGQAYVELDKPGSLASYIDYANKEHYRNIRVQSASGINADDFNTLRSEVLGITDIDLSGVKQLTVLPDAIFKDARTLRSLVLPEGLTAIGNEAFEGCVALVSQLFPASLLTIGDRAFAGAFAGSEANRLDLSAAIALRSIGKETFAGCNALTQLVLPANLTEIGEGAFRECYNLSDKLVVPSGVAGIAASAFENTGFTEVDLPATLSVIGRRAFYNCPYLSVVVCRRSGGVPALDATDPAETFGGVGRQQRTLMVDAASVDLYKNDPLWMLATPATGAVVWKIEGINDAPIQQ